MAATVADYPRVTARPRPSMDLLHSLGEGLGGAAVTLLLEGTNVFGCPLIVSIQGRLSAANSRLFMAPRGAHTQTVPITPRSVLDLEPAYGAQDLLQERVAYVRAGLPRLRELTAADLLALPERAPDPAPIALAVFGTWRGPDSSCPGAVWLLHSYLREDDLADGVLILRAEHGHSESGSTCGRDLLTAGGAMIDPPRMDLQAALDLSDLPYPCALGQFVSPHPR